MAYEELVSIINAQIIPERTSRNHALTRRLLDEVEKAPAGAIHSSRLAIVLGGVAAAELEDRAAEWLSLAEASLAASDYPWTPDVARAVVDALEAELDTDLDEIVQILAKRPPRDQQPHRAGLDDARGRARQRIAARARLLLHAQERRVLPLIDKLGAQRYASVLAGWRAVLQKKELGESPGDVAHAAVSAVEELARIVNSTPTKTLGAIIADLKRDGRVQAPLLKSMEEIWGWTSGEPGVRHGARDSRDINQASADYVLRVSEAALHLLLDVDAL